jgi:hypothetical protein
MNYTCEEIDELLAPFALDALEEADRVATLEHLAECRLHDGDLAAYREVVTRLPAAIDVPAEPPARIEAALLRSFDTAGGRSGEEAPRAESMAPVRPTAPVPLLRRLPFAYGLAAALFVVAVGLGAIALLRDGDSDARNAIVRETITPEMHLRVVYLPEEGIAVVEVDLPAPAAGSVYQGWQITADGPISLGLIPHQGAMAFRADLSAAEAIAVSLEVSGGSATPTLPPVIATSF